MRRSGTIPSLASGENIQTDGLLRGQVRTGWDDGLIPELEDPLARMDVAREDEQNRPGKACYGSSESFSHRRIGFILVRVAGPGRVPIWLGGDHIGDLARLLVSPQTFEKLEIGATGAPIASLPHAVPVKRRAGEFAAVRGQELVDVGLPRFVGLHSHDHRTSAELGRADEIAEKGRNLGRSMPLTDEDVTRFGVCP